MTSKLLFKERGLVIPGQEMAAGMDYLPGVGTLRSGDNIVSTSVGLGDVYGKVIRVIPLKGKYIPKVGDTVIGKVSDILISGWRLDIGWAFLAGLRLAEASRDYIPNDADLSRYFNVGEYVACKITKISGTKFIDVTAKGPGLRKLGKGKVISCQSTKVPRIIGKQGSMISTIKEVTGCNITVGQNGIVWISGEDPKMELLVEKAIRKIENESHKSGLTETIGQFLEENK